MVMSGAVGSAVGVAGAVGGLLGDVLGLAKNNKAKLKVVDGKPAGGKTSLEVMFNPTTYSLHLEQLVIETHTAATPGAKQEYRGTNPMVFSCQLFFDEFAKPKGDVTPAISTLLNWMRPTEDTVKDKKPVPPTITFEWGGNKQLTGFKGFLTKCSVVYSLFAKDGTPIQAKVDIEIKGSAPDAPFTNPTSHAAGTNRAHTMIDGDTLQSIAAQELGTPSYWRAIADLNGIDDPLRLQPGTILLIPRRSDAAKSA
jgi:hypothetical protein